MHVEVHLGGDVFQTSETLARGARYGIPGYPDVFIEGTEDFVGADVCPTMITQYTDAIHNKLDEFEYLSPIDITGGMVINGSTATITADIELVDDVTLPALQATLFLVEDNITWCCGYGNVSHWDGVVRMVRSTAVAPTYGGGPLQVVQNVNIGAFNAGELHAYALVEAVGGSKQIYQATDFVPVNYFFAQSFAKKIASAPNGNETVLFDGFVKNLGEQADVIDLSIDSGFGWPADFQVEGDANWHTSTSVPLAAGEQKSVTVRVQTDGDVRIGEGTMTATGQAQGQIATSSMKVFNGSYAILLVDDDGTNSYEVTYTDAFDALGYLYEVHTVGQSSGPSASAMNGYDAVVWHTAYLGSVAIGAGEVADLTTYLDNGGGLFLTSLEFLGSQGGGTTFTSDYLGLASWTLNVPSSLVDGVSSDPITDGMNFTLQWPVSSYNRPDQLVMGNGSGILTGGNGGFVACRNQLPGGNRTVLNTVPLDVLVDGSEPSTAQTMIGRTLDWILGGGVDPTAVGDVSEASNLGLLNAWPNPFTPATELSFRLSDAAASEPVSLTLFDASGRQVRSLFEGQLEPGAHAVTWDGRDEANREVAGGVYFGRLSTASGDSQAKIIKVN